MEESITSGVIEATRDKAGTGKIGGGGKILNMPVSRVPSQSTFVTGSRADVVRLFGRRL